MREVPLDLPAKSLPRTLIYALLRILNLIPNRPTTQRLINQAPIQVCIRVITIVRVIGLLVSHADATPLGSG